VFGPLVQKLWRSIDFSFKLENAYSPENYPIFGGLYPGDEIFSDITCQRVSAWQCCMGGVAFLWERVNFGPRQNKNHPTDQDQIWQA
jgi:hypothetical protein